MYLQQLKNDQKNLFMQMAFHLSMIDGDYSEQEQILMKSYAGEMGIKWDEKMITDTLEGVIDKLQKSCGELEKKVIVFEIVGLAMSDGNYDAEERKRIKLICQKFGLKKEYPMLCENCINDYFKIQRRMNQIVEG